ncbi:MAG: hypothetical protein V1673_03895 [Candidatus Omnitrophota bacterium]
MFFIFVSVLAGMNLGLIRKAEDPIRDTQTDPILYKQKKEEEKDGKKGPLLYHVKNNPRESFFIDPPFEKEKGSSSREIATGKETPPSGTADWWEEQSTEPRAISPGETAPKSVPEPLPEAEKVPDDKAPEQPAARSETEDAASGKGDNYWW